MNQKYNRILLDIDNTITDLQTVLDIMAFKLNKPRVFVKDIHNFQLSQAFGITKEEDIQFWIEHENFLAKHAKLAKERTFHMLNQYTNSNTHVDVVTMRPKSVYKTTKNWLIQNNIPFDQLICIGKENNGISKIDIAKDLNAQAIFEDNPAMFEHIHDQNIQSNIDLYLIDYPYNQHIQNAIRLNRNTGKKIK